MLGTAEQERLLAESLFKQSKASVNSQIIVGGNESTNGEHLGIQSTQLVPCCWKDEDL